MPRETSLRVFCKFSKRRMRKEHREIAAKARATFKLHKHLHSSERGPSLRKEGTCYRGRLTYRLAPNIKNFPSEARGSLSITKCSQRTPYRFQQSACGIESRQSERRLLGRRGRHPSSIFRRRGGVGSNRNHRSFSETIIDKRCSSESVSNTSTSPTGGRGASAILSSSCMAGTFRSVVAYGITKRSTPRSRSQRTKARSTPRPSTRQLSIHASMRTLRGSSATRSPSHPQDHSRQSGPSHEPPTYSYAHEPPPPNNAAWWC